MKMKDLSKLVVNGQFKDIIKTTGGEVIEETPWDHNIVVTVSTTLIAALIAGKVKNHKLYWAVGSGDESWEHIDVPATVSDSPLTNEIGRKNVPLDTVEFYDIANNPTNEITNRIHITITFEEDECNGDWREFGIFGGDVTDKKDSGIMIDNKRHKHITKTEDIIVERHLILTFNLGMATEEA